MSVERVLIVDDDLFVQKSLGELLRRRSCTVTIAPTIAEGERILAAETFDLAFIDVRLPDGDGHEFFERLLARPDRPLAVLITGHGTVENAVHCMRLGAFDYLIKPFTPGQIDVVLRKADNYRQLVNVNRYFQQEDGGGELIGRSPAIQQLRQLIGRVAATDATVLITGENGTGKELVARELFRLSPRRDAPYIKVNCAALSETLIESELFGHEKGSFTGATERREGRFELANRGTLLLDEVSEIPPNLQAKLLRVLQEREFERVGGTKTIKVNVRLIATSNRDLLAHVEKGHFRLDLYYRLAVFPIGVPPLRERPEDIHYLAERFLERFSRKHHRTISGFTANALAALSAYPWPGNVRELQNTIERCVILTEDNRPVSTAALALPRVEAAAIPVTSAFTASPSAPAARESAPPVTAAPAPLSVPLNGLAESSPPGIQPLELIEQQAIFEALRSTSGNRTRAADLLKVSIRTLRNKLALYRERGEIPADLAVGD